MHILLSRQNFRLDQMIIWMQIMHSNSTTAIQLSNGFFLLHQAHPPFLSSVSNSIITCWRAILIRKFLIAQVYYVVVVVVRASNLLLLLLLLFWLVRNKFSALENFARLLCVFYGKILRYKVKLPKPWKIHWSLESAKQCRHFHLQTIIKLYR